MSVSVAQLMTAIETKWMIPLLAEIETLKAAAEGTATVEDRVANKELTDALELRMTEYDAALIELQKVQARKEMPDEEKEATKKHKFRSFPHYAHDLWRAGPGLARPSEELTSWLKHCADLEVEKRTVGDPSQNVGELESGGALVPTEYSETMLERISTRLDLMNSATIIPMATNAIKIPFLEGFDESQCDVAGGVVAYWKGEEKQYAASKWEVGTVGLTLSKLTGLAFMTAEIMKWSAISVEPLLYRAFEQAFIKALTRGIIRGTGVDMPLGILDTGANGTLTVSQKDGQDPDTVVLDNILQMYAQFYGDIGDGTWYANRMLLPQLVKLNQEVGTGGSNVFLMDSQIQNSLSWVLLGMRLVFCDQMSAAGDLGDIGLMNMKEYLVGQPTGQVGPDVSQSIHLKFDFDQTCFKFTSWYDGQPWWPETFKPPYGDELSPFVLVEAR